VDEREEFLQLANTRQVIEALRSCALSLQRPPFDLRRMAALPSRSPTISKTIRLFGHKELADNNVGNFRQDSEISDVKVGISCYSKKNQPGIYLAL
jgi:hypothetical protein